MRKVKSKGEEQLLAILKERFPKYAIWRNYHIGENLSVDLYIPLLNIAIEFDGIQHFERVQFFHPTEKDFAEQQERDARKDAICEELHINLVRIPYYSELDSETLLAQINNSIKWPNKLRNPPKKRYQSESSKRFKEKMKNAKKEYFRRQYTAMKKWKKAQRNGD